MHRSVQIEKYLIEGKKSRTQIIQHQLAPIWKFLRLILDDATFPFEQGFPKISSATPLRRYFIVLYICGRIHSFFCAFLQDIISIQFTRMFEISMIEFAKNTKKISDYDDLKDVTISRGGRSKVCLSAIFLENWIYKIFSLTFRDLLDQLVRNFALTFGACIRIFIYFTTRYLT